MLLWACRPAPPTASVGNRQPRAAVDVQGHRGARGLRPENTIPGFVLSAELGVTTLELDLHLTADERLVVWHDPELRPEKCDVHEARAIRSMTLAEVREVVCDRNPDPARFPKQLAPTAEDFHVVELDRVLGLSEAAECRFNIELKRVPDNPATIGDDFDGVAPATFERALVAAVHRFDAVPRVTVQSFDHRALWAIAKLEPKLELAALTEGGVDLDSLVDGGAAIWSPNHAALSASEIERAHALGLRVIPWTVNDPEALDRMLQLGVDGLISDRPDLALAAVDRAGVGVDRRPRR